MSPDFRPARKIICQDEAISRRSVTMLPHGRRIVALKTLGFLPRRRTGCGQTAIRPCPLRAPEVLRGDLLRARFPTAFDSRKGEILSPRDTQKLSENVSERACLSNRAGGVGRACTWRASRKATHRLARRYQRPDCFAAAHPAMTSSHENARASCLERNQASRSGSLF
jgi:hypothetical protein